MRARTRISAALVGVLAVSLVAVGIAAPATADDEDFPSWAEVEAAKHDEKAKKQQIGDIQTLIGGLEDRAAALTKDALEAAEAYNQAKDEADAAAQEAETLERRASAASAKADESQALVAVLIAHLARSNGVDLTLQLAVDSAHANDLLGSLGLTKRLTAQSASVWTEAKHDRETADALSDRAALAQKERDRLADAAQGSLATAQAASSEAQAKVDAQKKQSNTLYKQLAELKDTSADIEKQYQQGLAWERAQAAVKTPPAPPVETSKPKKTSTPSATPRASNSSSASASPSPSASSSNSSSSSGGSSDAGSSGGSSDEGSSEEGSSGAGSSVGAPSGSAVDGAIAFAKNQLGERYVLGGMGPDTWDCSGLTKAAYAAVGVYIGTHSATNQYSTMAAQGKLLPLADLQPGDLLFYSSGGSTGGSKYHTTIYLGGGRMIEAPYPGVTVRIAAIRYGDLVPYAGRPTG
jgi:cell wall-associated NlpC family hydrolase